MKEKYCFITVNYNNKVFTEKYIINILEMKTNEKNIEIIIVDNDSTNKKEVEELKEFCRKFENVKFIQNNKNSGYFSGLNIGIREAKKEKFEYLIIGNNDLTFDLDFLEKLSSKKYKDDIIVIAPNIVTLDGRHQNPHYKNKMGKIEKIESYIYNFNYYLTMTIKYCLSKIRKKKRVRDSKQWNESTYIWAGIGACYVLNNNFFKYIVELDESVFLWGEEVLLAHQVETVGKKIYYDKDLHIEHHESASVSSIVSKKKYKIVKKSFKIYSKYL